MAIFNSIVSWFMKKRIHQVELFLKYPLEVQEEWRKKLLLRAKDTEWGKRYDFASMQSADDFRQRVPIHDYDSLKPEIDRLRKGEQNILWPSEIKLFAKSSGTTSDKSKFIPVSSEAIEECHYNGGKDLLCFYCHNFPETNIFSGKVLALGGSHQQGEANSYSGDISALLIQHLPLWMQLIRTPDLSVTLLEKWEEKIDKMARLTINENVTSISGVPTWTIVLANRVLEITGKKNLLEVWPNLELFTHGAVSFVPYREHFKQLIPSAKMNYVETYNASEGFFGIQDRSDGDDMLLMLDYGVYYEFLPPSKVGDPHAKTILLSEVQLNTDYALIITTNAGLWRYMIGDTIRFTNVSPFRFKISGRTKHFINAFGEEVIIDNAEQALKIACEKTASLVTDYTVAPIFFAGKENAAHEWLIEFEKEPLSIEYFCEVLDNALKSVNSDYEAKRYKDMALRKPVIHRLQKNTFYEWMRSRGKLGGQNKVPRLFNDRLYVDDIHHFIKTGSSAIIA
jgi:hypothetical protein